MDKESMSGQGQRRVRLDALDDTNWARQLCQLQQVYSGTRATKVSQIISQETLRTRTAILLASIGMLMQDKVCTHVKTLAQVTPEVAPRLFEIWDERGLSKRVQINYFMHLRWFWNLCGLQSNPLAARAGSGYV